MRFALLQIKVALATLMYKFKITPCARTDFPIKIDPATLIYAPAGQVWLHVKNR